MSLLREGSLRSFNSPNFTKIAQQVLDGGIERDSPDPNLAFNVRPQGIGEEIRKLVELLQRPPEGAQREL